MFDIGFPELLLISVIVLLVFGPERLPEVLRTAGRWMGYARRSFTNLRSEIEREVGADDIRRDLHNARIMEQAREFRDELDAAGRDVSRGFSEARDSVEHDPDASDAEGERVDEPPEPPEASAPGSATDRAARPDANTQGADPPSSPEADSERDRSR